MTPKSTAKAYWEMTKDENPMTARLSSPNASGLFPFRVFRVFRGYSPRSSGCGWPLCALKSK